MKKIFLGLILCVSLILNACGEDESMIVTASVEDIYTAVAITTTAQYTPATATETMLPTYTNTIETTPTETPTMADTPQPAIASSSSSSSSTSACDSSEFVGDTTIPDGTVLAPGQSFEKTWLLKNNGSCNWTEDYEVIFVSGEDMDGEDTAIDTDVSSGSQVKVSVSMIAPDTEGSYTGFWKMMNEEGATFGTSFYVQIVVSDSASILTPTSTATTYTSTPTSTSESAATSTPTPTTVIVATNTPIPATATTAPTNTSQPTSTTEPSLTPTNTPTEITGEEATETPSS
ncbi:MAG: hypothetical protein JW908_07685 [Anaerolineales bacterium]|nr:hypothetical protein [Anaerolineales bacterium]